MKLYKMLCISSISISRFLFSDKRYNLFKVMFLEDPCLAKQGGPDLALWLQKQGPGSEISKLRIEKTCRIQWSMPQTAP